VRLRVKGERGLIALALLVALIFTARTPSWAGDRITVRGNYYREASTRVLAPSITFSKDLPDERFTLQAEYLLDAITSASVGAASEILGGDMLFTELRHESTVSASSKLADWQLGAFFRYSTETDYQARIFGASIARDLFQKNVNLSLSYSGNRDRIYRIVPGDRVPWQSSGDTNLLQIHYLRAGYSQSFLPTLLAGLQLEGAYSVGPQDNPYRRVVNADNEHHPWTRKRFAPSIWARWMAIPSWLTIVPSYRFYVDDWGIKAHAAEGQVHMRFAQHWRARVRYRYYTQNEAFFFRADNNYTLDDEYRTADPKVTAFHSHTPGLQLTWELDGISQFKGLGWLRGAWVQGTYNHVIQTNRFGNARLGSLAFSIPY
jgi:hypothetical protein